jgi:hypothetical protein
MSAKCILYKTHLPTLRLHGLHGISYFYSALGCDSPSFSLQAQIFIGKVQVKDKDTRVLTLVNFNPVCDLNFFLKFTQRIYDLWYYIIF